jgi:fructuronate reductase
VHFGPGAFHRAHQAFYFDQLLAKDPRWGICAVSLKSPGVRDALQPQDGLYTLAQLDAETTFRVVGSILEVLVAPEDPPSVFARLAAPTTRMVTLTVTEKGYCLTGDGKLDGPSGHRPRPGPSARAGQRRRLHRRGPAPPLHQAGLPPYAVVACDNLADNGWRLKAAVVAFAEAIDPALAAWIEAEGRFPRTMVDSITPATDDALRARVETATGLTDAWPIQREAFTQWVVEDVLGDGAPDLASVGVTLTDDVRGFERAKLRLLNGVHSTIAYAGLLKGHETVFEAISDPELAKIAEDLMVQDIIPTLTAPRGLDLAGLRPGDPGPLPQSRDPPPAEPDRLGRLAEAAVPHPRHGRRRPGGRPLGRPPGPAPGRLDALRPPPRAEAVKIVDPLADRLSRRRRPAPATPRPTWRSS